MILFVLARNDDLSAYPKLKSHHVYSSTVPVPRLVALILFQSSWINEGALSVETILRKRTVLLPSLIEQNNTLE